MGIFYSREQYQGYNIYSMKKYVDKKRMIFNIMVIILTILTLCLVVYYIIDTKMRIEKSKEYVAQIIEYKEQEELRRQEEEKKKQEKISKLTEVGRENIKNIYKSETKRAFLTFDDGPSKNTKEILDILKENDIKATFFVLGCQVEVFPETTKRIYDEGHYIANHGYSHIYSSIYQSPEQVLVEFNQCNQIVANAIEIPEYNSHLFRFPGGSVRRKICEFKERCNITIRTK